ncbi:MAG: TetR family transcriptional regulator [Caulobacterales bacterium]
MDRTSRKQAPQRGQLSRQAIAEAAAGILAAEGLTGLTMRKVAGALGVEAMSLYNHVRDKRDLLDSVAGLKLSRLVTPDRARPWPERLRTILLSLYEILTADPWLVMVLTTEQIEPREPAVLAAMEAAILVFEEAGLSRAQRVSAFRGGLALCFGLVLTHTIGLRMTPSQAEKQFALADLDQWSEAGVPHLADLAPQFMATRPGDDLRFMLDAYVAALERQPPRRVTA